MIINFIFCYQGSHICSKKYTIYIHVHIVQIGVDIHVKGKFFVYNLYACKLLWWNAIYKRRWSTMKSHQSVLFIRAEKIHHPTMSGKVNTITSSPIPILKNKRNDEILQLKEDFGKLNTNTPQYNSSNVNGVFTFQSDALSTNNVLFKFDGTFIPQENHAIKNSTQMQVRITGKINTSKHDEQQQQPLSLKCDITAIKNGMYMYTK